MSKRGVNRPRL